MDPISLARELEAIAQTGLHYCNDQYDRERYERLREVSAELLAESSNLTKQDIYEWRKAEYGYATPKVDVRAFIVQNDKVLLIREDADEGRWTLPGGWADVNDTPSQAIIREVEEESGYKVETLNLLAVLDREKQGHTPPMPYHVYKLFFHCKIIGGQPRATNESSESGFFSVDDLPELSHSRILEHQLKQLYEAVKTNNTAAMYD